MAYKMKVYEKKVNKFDYDRYSRIIRSVFHHSNSGSGTHYLKMIQVYPVYDDNFDICGMKVNVSFDASEYAYLDKVVETVLDLENEAA